MYDEQTIEFIDGSNLRNELSNRNVNARAANEIDLVKLEPFLDLEILFADKDTVERLKEKLGLKSKMFKLRPLSYYTKGEGKQILSSLGLELTKYQKNRKTYYKLCKKI